MHTRSFKYLCLYMEVEDTKHCRVLNRLALTYWPLIRPSDPPSFSSSSITPTSNMHRPRILQAGNSSKPYLQTVQEELPGFDSPPSSWTDEKEGLRCTGTAAYYPPPATATESNVAQHQQRSLDSAPRICSSRRRRRIEHWLDTVSIAFVSEFSEHSEHTPVRRHGEDMSSWSQTFPTNSHSPEPFSPDLVPIVARSPSAHFSRDSFGYLQRYTPGLTREKAHALQTALTVAEIDNHVQEVTVRLIRALKPASERKAALHLAILGLTGVNYLPSTRLEAKGKEATQSWFPDREHGPGGDDWVVHAPIPLRVSDAEYCRL
ncbi:hypothetical protein DFP72DRAFT_846941 [Ephemerocybe angulata]|uniref:Uncharacterized protein n=1 Tax=Ephemerocybe angulata TaxID=980116 RepID=A0A8H6I2H4_9AGAR|nr:hypothetical protein DFP72DRAFT_846941 [Tulosesus angulatus]